MRTLNTIIDDLMIVKPVYRLRYNNKNLSRQQKRAIRKAFNKSVQPVMTKKVEELIRDCLSYGYVDITI